MQSSLYPLVGSAAELMAAKREEDRQLALVNAIILLSAPIPDPAGARKVIYAAYPELEPSVEVHPDWVDGY